MKYDQHPVFAQSLTEYCFFSGAFGGGRVSGLPVPRSWRCKNSIKTKVKPTVALVAIICKIMHYLPAISPLYPRYIPAISLLYPRYMPLYPRYIPLYPRYICGISALYPATSPLNPRYICGISPVHPFFAQSLTPQTAQRPERYGASERPAPRVYIWLYIYIYNHKNTYIDIFLYIT